MATETVTPRVFFEEPFKGEAQDRVNDLFDVVALLDAAADRIDAASTAKADDQIHSTLRLVQIAQEKVRAAIDTFSAHI